MEDTKQIKVSNTDPQSGYLTREGKPEGFYYLNHVTVDGKLNLVTDVHVTPGNVHDATSYIERLDYQVNKFNFQLEEVALDSGYLTTSICHELKKRGIFAVIGYRRFHSKQGLFHKWQYKYNQEGDYYKCPADQKLAYRTTTRKGYREYVSDPKVCVSCEKLERCTHSKDHKKVITRHVWEESKEWIRANRLSERGKKLYKRRKETVERSFADAKQLHGLRYARYRGISKVLEQCLLTAACQNMKKIANHLWDKRNNPNSPPNPFPFIYFLRYFSPKITYSVA